MEFAQWKLSAITRTIRGAKQANITIDDAPIRFRLDETYAPFGISKWTPTDTKASLDVAATNKSQKIFQDIDRWILDQLCKNPKEYFGKELSRAQIEAMWKPSVTERERDGQTYAPTIRLKCMTFGPHSLRCWTKDKEKTDTPEDLKSCRIQPMVTVKGLWFLNNQVGCSFGVDDIIVCPLETSCPF